MLEWIAPNLTFATAAIGGYLAYASSRSTSTGFLTALGVGLLAWSSPTILGTLFGDLALLDEANHVTARGAGVVIGANALMLVWMAWLRLKPASGAAE